MLRQGAPSPHFTGELALLAHYRAVQQRAGEAVRRADERRVAVAARARIDALVRDDARVLAVLDPARLAIEPRRIIASVAGQFGLTPADILGSCRNRPLVRARHAAIIAVHEAHPHLGPSALSRIFGKNHALIHYVFRTHARGQASSCLDGGGAP